MKPNRMRRINELIKREIGDLCERDISTGSGTLITITDVDTSPDLRHADVFVSVFGEDKKKNEAMAKLEKQRVHFQQELARRVRLKYTPVLHFKMDTTLERADRVLHILQELDLNQSSAPADKIDDADENEAQNED